MAAPEVFVEVPLRLPAGVDAACMSVERMDAEVRALALRAIAVVFSTPDTDPHSTYRITFSGLTEAIARMVESGMVDALGILPAGRQTVVRRLDAAAGTWSVDVRVGCCCAHGT